MNWAIATTLVSSRDLLVNPLMGPGMIEIRGVLIQHPLKVPIMQDEQVVKAPLSHRPNPPLRKGILLARQQHEVRRMDHNSSK